MLNLRMYTVTLQTYAIQFLLAFLPITVSSTLDYEHGYAPAHEYKNHDYSFSYGVKDLHSGDVKQQWEKKEGDTVKGSYSLIEPDGRVRIVDYHADKESGFTATVKHKGVATHPVDKHAQGYSSDHGDHKPTSHNEFNIKPGTPVIQYNHHSTTNSEDPSPYNPKEAYDPAKYEIKYFYPSELKKYQEALAAQQQYEQSKNIHPVTEEQEEGGEEQEEGDYEQHGNESQEKQVHYYIPQTYDSKEGKSEKDTNVPQAYLDASETQLQPQTIPLDLTYVKQGGSSQIPIGVNSLNIFRQPSSYQQPRIPSTNINKFNKAEISNNLLLKDVYAAIKNAYNFSPPQLENGFKPLGSKTEESSAAKIKPNSASLGLGQYSNLNIGEVTKYTHAPPSKEQKLYYLPSFYENAKNLRTQNIHKTFKSRSSSSNGRSTARVGKAPRNLKPKH